MEQDLGGMVAWVRDKGFSLSLSTERLAFIFAVNEWSKEVDRELQENDLSNAYRIVNDEFQVEVENFNTRLNNLVQSLIEQRLLIQIRAGAFDEACYRLSPLAVNIANAYQTDQAYSKIKITLMLSSIASKISAIIEKNKEIKEIDIVAVHNELKLSIVEDLLSVDLVQRNMDELQVEVKTRIRGLLQKDFSTALEEFKFILDETASKLNEVSKVISVHSDLIQSKLNDLQEMFGNTSEFYPLFEQVEQINHKIDRICRWGEISFKSWAQYNSNVLNHIRKIISIDSSRLISERLLRKIVHTEEYGLTVMNSDRIVSLRDTTLRNTQKAVTGKVVCNKKAKAREVLIDLDGLIRSWFTENINTTKDIDVAELIVSVLKAFPEHSQMVVAQKAILIAQEFKRPAKGAQEAKWVNIPGFGHVKSKKLERQVK